MPPSFVIVILGCLSSKVLEQKKEDPVCSANPKHLLLLSY